MLPDSIRGRLLLWFAGLLLFVLVGFGFTAYELNRQSELRQIDDELVKRVGLLQTDWRRSIPPGGRRERPPDFARDGREDEPPPRFPGEDRGPPPDGPPPSSRPGRSVSSTDLQLRLKPETENLFGNNTLFYYAAWTSRGALLAKSSHAPADLNAPTGASGQSYQRTRGIYREAYHFTEVGDCVLAGISTAEAVAASRRFALTMTSVGGVILLIGVGGGWMLIGRSLLPLRSISNSAERIADGALSERIVTTEMRQELRGLAAVLNATFSRLEASFAEQRNFTADASHELRTPVTVILAETQRVLARGRSLEEYQNSLSLCQTTAREMKVLTESLLELARLDAGQEVFAQTEFDLASTAISAVERVRPLALQRKIAIELSCHSVSICGDEEKINRVIINLLQNAIHYNREEGSIHISTSRGENDAIIVVSDTGPGISPEDLPHVFERFYRADKARARKEGNSGLGLSICKSTVEAHGGTISVQSAIGVGATFTVRLPRALD